MTNLEHERSAQRLLTPLCQMHTVEPEALRGDAYGDWWIQNETGVKKLLAELDDCDLCEIVCADSLGALVSAAKTLRTKLRRDIRAAIGQTDMEEPERWDGQS
jgi:hypothetical protein